MTKLYHDEIPWADNTTYGFTLDFEPGTIRIGVREGATVLDTIVVRDSTYASGPFGFYDNSQNALRYTGFTETTISTGSYAHDVDATDPEGDPVAYSLTQAPAGMTIDPTTGLIEWMPGEGDIGSHDVDFVGRMLGCHLLFDRCEGERTRALRRQKRLGAARRRRSGVGSPEVPLTVPPDRQGGAGALRGTGTLGGRCPDRAPSVLGSAA